MRLCALILAALTAEIAWSAEIKAQLAEHSLKNTVRRIVRLKVVADENGQFAKQSGLTLTNCLSDPPLDRFLYNHFSGVEACEYCMTTVGRCSKDNKAIESIFVDDTETYRGYRMVITNGIPDHLYQTNNTCEYYRAMMVPIHTRVARSESARKFKKQPPGMVGIATSGGFIYNDLTNEGKCGIIRSIIEEDQQRKIDDFCDGHSTIANCQTKSADNYGCYPNDWVYRKGGQCNLDKANGYLFEEDAESLDQKEQFFKGQYVYFYSEEFPYTPLYYTGENPGYNTGDAVCGVSPTNYRYLQPNEFYQRLCIRGRSYDPDQPIIIVTDPPQIPRETSAPAPAPAPTPAPAPATSIIRVGSVASNQNR